MKAAKFPTREEQEAQFLEEWKEANPELADQVDASPEPPVSKGLTGNYRRVLEAALYMETSFTFADLVVRAFVLNRIAFALDGYPNHPDARKVANTLYGKQGLITRGLIEPSGDGRYQICNQKGV